MESHFQLSLDETGLGRCAVPARSRPSGRTTIGCKSPTFLMLAARAPMSPSFFLKRLRTLILLMSNLGIESNRIKGGDLLTIHGKEARSSF